MENPSVMADFFGVLWLLWFGILVTERSRSAPTKRNVMEPKRKGENECRISAIAQ
jgi:hypothetical protein